MSRIRRKLAIVACFAALLAGACGGKADPNIDYNTGEPKSAPAEIEKDLV